MLFKRKHVLCSNCGFLGFRTEAPDGSWKTDTLSECRKDTRHRFQAGEFEGEEWDYETDESYKIHCLRTQWILSSSTVSLRNWLNADAIRQLRRCLYYIKYEPGYRPEEHKELQREAKAHNLLLKGMILASAIGAIIGGAIYAVAAAIGD